MRKIFIFLFSFLGAIYANAQEHLVQIFNKSQGLVILQSPEKYSAEVYQYLPANEGSSFTISTTQDLKLEFVYAKEEDSKTACTFAINVKDSEVSLLTDAAGNINCSSRVIQRNGQSVSYFLIQ